MGAEDCSRGIETLFSKSQLPQLPAFNYFRHRSSMSRSTLQQSLYGKSEEQSVEDVNDKKRKCLPRLEQSLREDDEEKWSLVDLLSRSTSASSQSQRYWHQNSKSVALATNQSQPKSELLLEKSHVPFHTDLSRKISSSSEGRWARPTFYMTEVNRLDESLEGTDDGYTDDNCEGSEYVCGGGVSSASSISWAEDAVEAEQTINLAKLWHEVESVCRGDPKPEKMSNKVYEECLMWRKAFPSESGLQSYRFESMEEFLNEVEPDEDSTPTPTNYFYDCSIHNMGSPYPSSIIDLPNCDDAECSTPTPPQTMTSDLVTAWLSECRLQDASVEHQKIPDVPISKNDGVEKFQKPQSSYSVKSSGRNSSLLIEQSSKAFTDRSKSSNVKTRVTLSTTLPKIQDKHTQIDLIKKEITDDKNVHAQDDDHKIRILPPRERPSRLPIPIPKDDKFIGKTSSKPFLLWLFDRVSPN